MHVAGITRKVKPRIVTTSRQLSPVVGKLVLFSLPQEVAHPT